MTTYYDSNLTKAGMDSLQNALGEGALLVNGAIQVPEQNGSIHEWHMKGSVVVDEDSFYTTSQVLEIKGNAGSFEEWTNFITGLIPAGPVENNFFNWDCTDRFLEK